MYELHSMTIVISFALSLLNTSIEGTIYEKEHTHISNDSVVKRWTNVGATTCLLRCRRNADCKLAAIERSDCLFLKNDTKLEGDSNSNDDIEKLPVILLRDLDQLPKDPPPGNVNGLNQRSSF